MKITALQKLFAIFLLPLWSLFAQTNNSKTDSIKLDGPKISYSIDPFTSTFTFSAEEQKNLSFSDIKPFLSKHPKAFKMAKTARTYKAIYWILGIPSSFIFGYTLGYGLGSRNINGELLGVSGVGMVGGIVFGLVGESQYKKAIELYNSSIQIK